MPKRIVITSGDVNGIGLRCLAYALENRFFDAELALTAAPQTLQDAITVYNLPGTIRDNIWSVRDQHVQIVALDVESTVAPGIPSEDSSRHAIASLDRAITSTVAGNFDGIVTLPINKHALSDVGWPYAGQTEMLGAYSNGDPLMVLCTNSLRVALATVHVPIRRVADMITPRLVEHRTIQLISHLEHRLGIENSSVAVLALNPHAGDNCIIGDEDTRIIAPAIQSLVAQGFRVSGPHPADGFFAFGEYEKYDGILAMYHDQGLIPLKLLAKGAGVNVTAGLSIIRTSPDHGTAYDRAHSVHIDYASTALAIEMAIAGG